MNIYINTPRANGRKSFLGNVNRYPVYGRESFLGNVNRYPVYGRERFENNVKNKGHFLFAQLSPFKQITDIAFMIVVLPPLLLLISGFIPGGPLVAFISAIPALIIIFPIWLILFIPALIITILDLILKWIFPHIHD